MKKVNKAIHLTIDASAVAIPCARDGQLAVSKYITRIIELSNLISEPCIKINVSYKSSDILLHQTDMYPNFNNLERLFQRHSITHVDSQTVYCHIQKLLSRYQTFEVDYEIEDVLAIDSVIRPQPAKVHESDELTVETERCMIVLALVSNSLKDLFIQHMMLLPTSAVGSYFVTSKIIEVQPADGNWLSIEFPSEIKDIAINVCDSVSEALMTFNPELILSRAASDEEVNLALFLSRIQSNNIPFTFPLSGRDDFPSLDSSFRESCVSICSENDSSLPSKILRTIERVIERKERSEHSFRVNARKGSHQYTEDGWRGFRCHIDGEFRMHYLRKRGDRLRLVYISCHEDGKIPKDYS